MKFVVAVCLLLSTVAAVAAQDEVVKVKTTLVNVPVIVSDRDGRYIAGLKAEDFTVYQDGAQQTVSFFAAEEEPLNVALLLDTSKSTRDVLGKIRDAAKDFLKRLQPADRAAVVTFDYQVSILSPLTSDRKALEKAVKDVEVGAQVGTVLRDAVQTALRNVFKGVKGRKAVILLTDGKDFGSYPTQSDLLQMLEESDVMVYSVFYETERGGFRLGNRGGIFGGRRRGGGFPRRGPDPDVIRERRRNADEEAIEFLTAMSDLTAGRFYRKESTDLKKTFALIADELRQQYRLGYYPAKPDETPAVHEIKVRVHAANVAVRYRRTYRAQP